VSLFTVAILPVLASTSWLFILVTGDKSSERFHETWFVAPVALWDRPLLVVNVQLYTTFMHYMIPYLHQHHTALLNTRESVLLFYHVYGHFILSSEPPACKEMFLDCFCHEQCQNTLQHNRIMWSLLYIMPAVAHLQNKSLLPPSPHKSGENPSHHSVSCHPHCLCHRISPTTLISRRLFNMPSS
jgi:hypothetical protein